MQIGDQRKFEKKLNTHILGSFCEKHSLECVVAVTNDCYASLNVQSVKKRMKLVLVIMGYCLLQFDALKYFLRIRLHGLSNVNPLNRLHRKN